MKRPRIQSALAGADSVALIDFRLKLAPEMKR